MTNQQGAPEAPKSTALDGKTELFHVSGYPLLVRAVDFNRLYAENAALQQGYNAARLEIDHLRGATKSKLLAQPVAWLVYLPSIDTQNVYDSQDDPGYVYPAITTEFINKHAHPSQAAKLCRADWSGKDESSVETVHPEVIKLLHAYVDADRAMRAQAAPAFIDSTPELHVGDSAFESWYSTYNPAHKSDKQRARDAYAAGMGDPLVMAAPVAQGDAEDAARWRWLRENWFTMTSSYDQQRIRFKVGEPRWSDIAETELDAAIDAARSQAKEGDQHG